MKSSITPRNNFTIGAIAKSRRTIFDLLKIIHGSTIPGYMIYDFDMTLAEELRANLKKNGHKTTVTAILLKAIGIAQLNHPSSRTEVLPFGNQVTYNDIVAGFTVERMIDKQATVFLGEITEPHNKSVIQIAKELKEYAVGAIESVKPIRLQNTFSKLPWIARSIILYIGLFFPAMRLNCQKATFGLTSLGNLGVDSLFCPCLCSASFGIGTMEDRPIVKNRIIKIQKTMTVTLNFNQKALDPVSANRFVLEVKRLIEGGLEEYIPKSSNSLAPETSKVLVAASV